MESGAMRRRFGMPEDKKLTMMQRERDAESRSAVEQLTRRRGALSGDQLNVRPASGRGGRSNSGEGGGREEVRLSRRGRDAKRGGARCSSGRKGTGVECGVRRAAA